MRDKYFIPYINTCIRSFAKRYGLSNRDAHNYLRDFKGIDFLINYYHIEHLLSIDDAVDDMTIICTKNGGNL